MLVDYLEINSKENNFEKEVKKPEYKNLYDNHFNETAKLWKDSDSNKNLIQNISNGRIFFKNGNPAYFEIFEEPRTQIMGFSKKLSLLYAPLENINDKYDKNKCIGFRYYENNKLENCNYFTLVKRYENTFYILEKNKEIIDSEGISFYDEKLNCYSIMKNIVFEKYKNNEVVTPKGEVFPEIIGFIYSLISLGKFKGFKVVEPLILDPLNEKSRIEQIPKVLEEDIGYLEPIIFDNHISVVLIKKAHKIIKDRINIVLDMSRYHIEENLNDDIVFPEEIYLNNYQYPKYAIQKGDSCGVWFFGIMECIYTSTKYKTSDDVCVAIKKNTSTFYIDVINCLSSILYGISDMIDNSSIESGEIIKEKRIYELGHISHYSFREEAVMSHFFSLASLFAYYENKQDDSNVKFSGIEILLEYQYLLDNITNFLSLVIFNNNYFRLFSRTKNYEINQKIEYEDLIGILKTLLHKVKKNYKKEFNNLVIKQFKENLTFGNKEYNSTIKVVYNNLLKSVPKTPEKDIIDINKLKKEFSLIKFCDRKIAIKEESAIVKYLNPNSEIYFQMMIH